MTSPTEQIKSYHGFIVHLCGKMELINVVLPSILECKWNFWQIELATWERSRLQSATSWTRDGILTMIMTQLVSGTLDTVSPEPRPRVPGTNCWGGGNCPENSEPFLNSWMGLSCLRGTHSPGSINKVKCVKGLWCDSEYNKPFYYFIHFWYRAIFFVMPRPFNY